MMGEPLDDVAADWARRHAAAHPEPVAGCPMCADPRPILLTADGPVRVVS